MTAPEKRAIPPRKSWLSIALVLLLLALGLGFMLWYFALAPREPAVSYTPPTTTTEPAPYQAPTYPDRDPTALYDPDRTPQREAFTTVTAPSAEDPTSRLDPAEERCRKVSRQIEDFFTTLDQRDYIQQRQLAGGAKEYFGRLLDRLLANPPLVSGETSELFAILNNTAHFYRTLGAHDLWLLKEVLEQEGKELEKIYALFYRWSLIAPDCPGTGLNIHLPLPAIYEYAGFFINTLGGRSYLFRRDSRVRLLTTYYSVLILDRANEAGINRHGLDIRPAIENLLAELPGQQALQQRPEYLATLTELQDKYRRQYGK